MLWTGGGDREGPIDEWIAFEVAEGGPIHKVLEKVNPSQLGPLQLGNARQRHAIRARG